MAVKLKSDLSCNDRLEKLEQEVAALKEHQQAITVAIRTLDPEHFELCKEIMAVVQPDDDSFVATFFDANINASDITQVDAVANLKDMMVSLYDVLEKEPKLGKGPARQFAASCAGRVSMPPIN